MKEHIQNIKALFGSPKKRIIAICFIILILIASFGVAYAALTGYSSSDLKKKITIRYHANNSDGTVTEIASGKVYPQGTDDLIAQDPNSKSASIDPHRYSTIISYGSGVYSSGVASPNANVTSANIPSGGQIFPEKLGKPIWLQNLTSFNSNYTKKDDINNWGGSSDSRLLWARFQSGLGYYMHADGNNSQVSLSYTKIPTNTALLLRVQNINTTSSKWVRMYADDSTLNSMYTSPSTTVNFTSGGRQHDYQGFNTNQQSYLKNNSGLNYWALPNGNKITCRSTSRSGSAAYIVIVDAAAEPMPATYNFNLQKTGYTATGKWHVGSPYSAQLIDSTKSYENVNDLVSEVGQSFKNGDVTIDLYADWRANDYTLQLDPNGRPGNVQTQNYTWDNEFELAGNVFNNGSALMYWNTKADGSGKDFMPGEAIHNPTDENGKPVTKLYAQWLPDAVTINYNANGGEFLPDENELNSVVYKWDGQDATHPTLVSQSPYKEPVRDGYVFDGWESEDGAEFEGGDSIKAFSTKSTINVSAKWTPVDQNTTLKMKDGEVIFENEPLHDVKIKKVDATTGKALPGAGVKLQKKTSSGYTDIATKSTGSDGTAAFTGLKKGVYKIVETTAPLGYEINPKGWSFIISGASSGAAYKYTIKDLSTGKEFNTNDASDIRISDQTSPDLKLTKRDFGTDEPLRGGEFTLMNSWGLAYPSVKADENGVINFGPVPTGTYTLKEKSAPSGYSPYAGGWTIKIEQSGTEKKVTVTLNKQSGDSAANKEGLDGDASTKVYKFTTGQTMEGINIYNERKPLLRVIKRSRTGGNQPLSGAEFTLTPEGGGAPIVTKADSKGIVNIDGLQKNVEYLMRETKAPSGAKMSAIRWTITYDGSKVNISSTGKASNIDVGASETYGTSNVFAPTVTITDELLDSFALVKQDGDTGKAIAGAEFKFLTKAEYQEYLSAKSYKNQDLMDSLGINVKADATGVIFVPPSLINTGEKDIEIYAVETEAPAGYNKCDDIKINISIDANDKSTKKATFVSTGKALSLNANQKAIVPDYLYGDIPIVKKDGATKAALGGAGFKLTGTSRGGQEINESATSADGTGRFTFSGIPEGYNYIIKEDQAPAGYSEPNTTWHAVVITQNSSTFTRGDGQKVTLNKGTYVYDANWKLLSKDGADYVITNNAAASVSFRKVDQSTKEGLTGAEFALAGTSGNAAGDTRTIVTTGGTASFTSLKTGTYTLKETKAPDGYKISPDLASGYTITVKGTKNSDVTVSKNGTTLTADGTDNWLGTADDPCKQYDVSNAPSVEGESFSIYKTDLGTTPLPGTKFTLKKSGYTKTVTVDADGKASFDDIPYGTYQMTETPLAGYRTSKGQGYWTVTVAKRVKSGNNITGGVTIKAADGTILTPYKKGQMDSGYGLFIGENFIDEQGSATITGVNGDLAAGKDGKYLKTKDVNLMLKNSAGTTLKTFTSFPGDLDSLSLTSESTYTITGNYTVSDTGKDVKHYVAVSFTYYTDDPAKDAPKDPVFHIKNHQGTGQVVFEKKIDKTSTYLPGAVMQIKDSTGKVVKEWTTTNAAVSYTLDPGDYVLHEKNPPAGYDTAKDIPFTVYADDSMGSSTPGAVYVRNSDKVSVVQMYDTKGFTLPNVGGKGTTLLILTALACILAYAEREILKKRKALKER